jgi:hypothetical protein
MIACSRSPTALLNLLIGFAVLLCSSPARSEDVKPRCAHPRPATSYPESVVSNVPADLDPHLAKPPAPVTTIYFNVLVPEHCPGDRFPLVFNYAAWGTRRVRTIAPKTRPLPVDAPIFLSPYELVSQLPNYGYVVISADPRGMGESVPRNGGGVQRMMDPNAEIQDARAILDWAYDHARKFGIQTEPDSGIPKDLKVGTLGMSYGGGFQMSLAALDPRIDAIVPMMTWNDLYYSINPGDAIKLGWAGTLCLCGTLVGQKYTPDLGGMCRLIGVSDPAAALLRTRNDLIKYVGANPAQTLTAQNETLQRRLENEFDLTSFPQVSELDDFLEKPGMGWFASQQAAGQSWGFGESEARLRPVPALFIQGNSDLLFNLTEGYWNWRYFKATGADTRIMSINGGHNAMTAPNTGYCGAANALTSSLAWFDHYLKGQPSDDFDNIAKVCISVSDTLGAPYVKNIGVRLDTFPAGSLSGPGAVPAVLPVATASLSASAIGPVFVPVTTISGDGQVLAGVPSMASITVTRGKNALPNHDVVAFVATAIRRHGEVFPVDQQVTGFAEGTRTSDDVHIHQDDRVMLPAVGEQLQDGDEVGLAFYPHTYAFEAPISAQSPTEVPQLTQQLLGLVPVSNRLTMASNVDGLVYRNPYSVEVTDIQLPIFVPGAYPGSSLTQ